MMSRNVRRLVFDFAPHYQNGIGLFIWVAIAFMTAAWMMGKGSPNVLMLFSASVVTLSYAVKSPVWRSLPVSQAELGQTQWWHLFGRPLVFVLVSFALALVVVAVLGRLAVSANDLLAYAAAELFIVALIGLGPLLSAWLARPFKRPGYFIGLGALYLAAFAIGIRWMDKEAFRSHEAEMLIAGGCAVFVIALACLTASWLPLVKPNAPVQDATKTPSQPFVVKRIQTGATGWWGLLNILASTTLKILAICTALSVLVVLAARHGILAAMDIDLSWFFLLIPLLALLITMMLVQLIPHRLLGGLPLTPGQRALAIHMVAPAIQLVGLMIVSALMLFWDRAALTTAWFIRYDFTMLCITAYSALSQPFAIRFGRQGTVVLTGIIAALSGTVGILVGDISRGEHIVFGLDVHVTMLIVAIFLTVLLVASWIWTWLELKYGRAAYRHQPVVLLNWRGQGG